MRLRQRGIGVNLHYMPVHLQPYYRELGFHGGTVSGGRSPRTRSADHPAAVPRHMTDEEQEQVVACAGEQSCEAWR